MSTKNDFREHEIYLTGVDSLITNPLVSPAQQFSYFSKILSRKWYGAEELFSFCEGTFFL